MFVFNDKRILITQNALANIVGGEIAVLEQAAFLKQAGASVCVYVWYYGGDMRHFFDRLGVKVYVKGEGDDDLSLSDYDYIWVHNNVIPPSIVQELTDVEKTKRVPIFMFSHMSPLDSSPLDQPYIKDLESYISSASIFISEDTRKKLTEQFYQIPLHKTLLLRNPAPTEFSKLNHTPKKTIRKVLIVSNHPPSEIEEATEILANKGLTVKSVGELAGGRRVLVSPPLLSEFDVVVSIGKTVQYCLCAGIPIYIYDHFGGPGYLTAENFDEAGRYNFSGRSKDNKGDYITNRKSAADIVEELQVGYADAVKFQRRNKKAYIEEFSIDRAIPRLFADIKPRRVETLDVKYVNYILCVQRLVSDKIREVNNHIQSIRTLEERLQLELHELGESRRRVRELEGQIQEYSSSTKATVGVNVRRFVRKILSLSGIE